MKSFLAKSIRYLIGLFPPAAFTILAIKDALDRFQKPISTPWGFSIAGHKVMAQGKFEPVETEMIRRILPEADIFVNIGANIGYYCCHALSLGKQVIAVEPNMRNLWYLMKNIKNNGWSNQVEIFPVAIGEGPDILEIYGWGTGASLIKGWQNLSPSFASLTPTLSLDRIVYDKLNGKKALIMVDIEGAEYMLLKGAQKILAHQPPPIWIMEISLREHQPKEVGVNPNFAESFEEFFHHGYRCFTMDKENCEIKQNDIPAILKGEIALKTHNFMFCK